MSAVDLKKPKNKPIRYAVYFSESVGKDQALLHKVLDSLSAERRSSDFLRALMLRGWLHILHGLPRQERDLQLRAMELPDELIAEIQRIIPDAALFKPVKDDRSAIPGSPAGNAVAVDLVTEPEPLVIVPGNSRMGKVSSLGGLS